MDEDARLATDRRALRGALAEGLERLERELDRYVAGVRAQPVGTVASVARGVAVVEGLAGVRAEELLRFRGGLAGLALNVGRRVGAALLGDAGQVVAGSEVRRTGKVLQVPVGEELLGRVIDPLGRPLDERGPLRTAEDLPIDRPAPAIMDRDPVQVPLQTGIKVVDALIPVGRGQRELILGDRQSGKTAIALDAIVNQRGRGVACVYCAIGQRSSAVARLVDELRRHDALAYTTVVVADAEDPPGLQYAAPYAATSIAEWFMERGDDALIVYDDLTRHAWAYRELSLLLRRPPGREAYPGDIFFIHSRLLERATHLRQELGGGSLTALPIAETEAQNIAAYIPTNLISITDGQIYVSPALFHRGILPAIDVGRSVSRVGAQAQLPAFRVPAGQLRLAYAQFEELEAFARFSTQLDEETVRQIERGRRVREILQQSDLHPVPVAEQVAALIAVTDGPFDDLPVERIEEGERRLRATVADHLPEICERIEAGEALTADERGAIAGLARHIVDELVEQPVAEPGGG
jgi:F-type H+-transporting ATPase subunit alpha